jgi:hypothetical protein
MKSSRNRSRPPKNTILSSSEEQAPSRSQRHITTDPIGRLVYAFNEVEPNKEWMVPLG